MEREYARRGEPELDLLVEFTFVGDERFDERENPYAKWIVNNILEEDSGRADYIT